MPFSQFLIFFPFSLLFKINIFRSGSKGVTTSMHLTIIISKKCFPVGLIFDTNLIIVSLGTTKTQNVIDF